MKKHKWILAVLVAGSVILGLSCGEDKGSGPEPRLTLDVDSLVIEVSSSHQFTATLDGQAPEVYWYVDEVGGGDQWRGMITTGGLYFAPGDQPAGNVVTVMARAVEDTTFEATARVRITKAAGVPFVRVIPNGATISAADSVGLEHTVSGCLSDDVVWSLEPIWGTPPDIGTMRTSGMYVAPDFASSGFAVMAKATSLSCTDKAGIARINIPADPVVTMIELEDYTESYNIQAPHTEEIYVISCTHASEGKAVQGLDNEGEYIRVPMRVTGSGAYTATVRYAAYYGDTARVRVELEGCNGPAEEEFFLTEGTGVG
jgi:hypothetical protein